MTRSAPSPTTMKRAAALRSTGDDVMISEFLRFKRPNGRANYEVFAAAFAPMLRDIGGEVVLSVRAEMPIVSEEHWDHFVAFRFPSLQSADELYASDRFGEINAARIAGLERTLAVLSAPRAIPPKSDALATSP